MSILVTGAAGFIGARFVESCNKRKIALFSVDKDTYFQEREEHAGLDFGKVIDREHLFQWLGETNPDLKAVVHLGACSDTTQLDRAYLDKMNVEYSQQIWNWCTEKKVPLIYASSAATYGEGHLGYSDDESLFSKLTPLNPYGESKQRFDLWALQREKEGAHPPQWSGFKFFNVYGFGERHKRNMSSVVLKAYEQIQTSGYVKLFKSHREGILDGEQKRDFIFVEDAIETLHFAIEKPIQRGIFNLGTGKARSFRDLVSATFQALGVPEKIEFIDTPIEIRDRYQYFTQAEMNKLRSEGYPNPFTELEKGVAEYIDRLKLLR